jgi:LacI family transcriptional regulator
MTPPPTRRPTMKDVAGVAGVSLATVSRVVNGSDDVRPDLAARVHDAISVLGYRRDLTASTLRRADRLSASIGLVIEDVANPFFSALHRGVEDVARARRTLTFAASSDDDAERERELAEELAARGVDGLIVVPSGADQSHFSRERAVGTAIVFVDRPPRLLDADAVVSDNRGGARTGVGHLLAAGHRRIGFLGDRADVHTAHERRAGWVEALLRAGVEPDPALERLGLKDSTAGAVGLRELLDAPDPPTAVFTAQNLITVGAVHELRARGQHHEVALVGFDDVVLGDLLEPGISVVTQDPYAMGRRAAELLFARLDGDRSPSRLDVLPTELIARGSGELPLALRA